MHLLGGEEAPKMDTDVAFSPTAGMPSATTASAGGERMVQLAAEVDELRREIETLRQQFAAFQKQFE